MSRAEENNTKRNNPPNREVAYAFQLHDTTRNLYSFAHVQDPASFVKGLEVLRTQISSYFAIEPALDSKFLILNTHRLFKGKFKRKPLWHFVSEISGVGSTRAKAACVHHGWDPDQDTAKAVLNY